MNEFFSAPQYVLARMIFERSLGVIYFVAFLSAFNQFKALLGEKGLLPAPEYLRESTFKDSPGLFHWKYSDQFLQFVCLVGMLLSILIAMGVVGQFPIILHMLSWLTVYFLYLSIVNVGQEFYGFGWETMILEAGFFAAFMGPEYLTPSWIPILILRWMLFRTEMGAGLIKLRGDPCWRDLTCLYYHHETQPLPNPLSRFFHHSPRWIHRSGVVVSHFCQLIAPIGLFLSQPIAMISGGLLIFHQLILVISGNYSWLNWLTIVLGFLAIPGDATGTLPRPLWFDGIQYVILLLALRLSYEPLKNLFSPNQYMNYCWNRWHLVGAYGAFGSVTKERYEIVIEGSSDGIEWKEYEFKGKPGALNRTPPIVAPYHLRLDWMIWFLPFTVRVIDKKVYVRGHRYWFIKFMMKLLENDEALIKLIRINPFKVKPPQYVRAKFYQYHFTTKAEKADTGHLWKREFLGEFFPEISLESVRY
jgi:Lipase maturation factor